MHRMTRAFFDHVRVPPEPVTKPQFDSRRFYWNRSVFPNVSDRLLAFIVFPQPLHFWKSDSSTQYILRLAGPVLLEVSLSDAAGIKKV